MRAALLVIAVAVLAGCGEEETSTAVLMGSWEVEARATPVIVVQNQDTPSPLPFIYAARIDIAAAGQNLLVVSGLCPDAPEIVLDVETDRRAHYFGPPVRCASCLLPGYQVPNARDSWPACDQAVVELDSITFEMKPDGTLYGEGSSTITGCGRTWDTVLFQVRSTGPHQAVGLLPQNHK